MSVQAFVEQYGYAAVFLGCFLEGETVLVLGGFAAHLGYLSLPAVIGTAALAGFVGDGTLFFVGHRYGERIVARFPNLAKARPYVRQELARHGAWVVFFIRFAIGLRIAGPILVGASGMHPARFTPPNAAGALVWAIAIGSAGYLFGTAFTVAIEHAKRYEEIAFVVVAIGVLAIVALRNRWTARLESRARERASADAATDALE